MHLINSNLQKISGTLRIASAMCFIGHGIFGIITKPIWCNYFGVFGIGHDMAYHIMPFVGGVDILLGLSFLVIPTPAVVCWLVVWGFLTASLRPLSGEPFAELIERAGNFGAPLALLMLCKGKGHFSNWFRPMQLINTFDDNLKPKFIGCLQWTGFFLLLGHGMLNLNEKRSLVLQYSSLGFANSVLTAQVAGLFEIICAFLIIVKPFKTLILGLIIWKISTELFYPHYEIFEFIERGGSYGVLLALWFSLERSTQKTFQMANLT